jgi:hypothetical protein
MSDDLVKRPEPSPYWEAYLAEVKALHRHAEERMADRIEKLEAEVKSMAMDCLVAHGQASDAYQAQLAAEAKLQDQTHLIEQLFALLEITEQTDEGRYFHPNIIRSSRALDAEKLKTIMAELKRTVTENNKSDG